MIQYGDKAGEGKAYGNLGSAYLGLGDFKAAIDYCERQLQIAKELADKDEQAKAYCNLGIAHKCQGHFQLAIDFQESFLKISTELRNRSFEGKAYCNLGVAHKCMGNFNEAMRYFNCCLEVAKELGDKYDEGKAYANIGNVQSKLGDFKKAINSHQCDLEIAKELADKRGKGRAYSNLGNVYLSLKDFKTSIEYLKLSLEIWKDLNNRSEEGRVYGNLGPAYQSLGDVNKAIHFCELHLKNARELGDRSGEMRAYGNLAVAYDSLADLEAAISMLESSLQISKELNDRHGEGEIYCNLGQVYCTGGRFDMAFECFELGLKIAEELGNRPSKEALYGSLGHAYFKMEDYKTAKHYFDLQLKTAKDLLDPLHEAIACKNLSACHDKFGDLKEAVKYSRCSVKLLNKIRSSLRQKDSSKISLREKFHEAYKDLWRLLLKQGEVKEALHAAEQGRAQALNDLLEKHYALDETSDDGTATEHENIDEILSYLSPNTIFLAIEEKGIAFWVCKKGTEVESRKIKVSISEGSSTFLQSLQSLLEIANQEIGARNVKCEDRSLSKKTDVEVPVENSPQVDRQTHFLTLHKPALNQLYDILIDPIQDLFVGNELTFVPEGPLWLVPFPALQDSNGKYLCESFRIRMLPSLTSLKLISDCPVTFHRNNGVLLVGDPWVDLPSAREEVEIIGHILKALPLTGREATKDVVLKRLSEDALVHIAAHGLFETGEIALAPNSNETSPKEEDYLLTMKDVLRVHLRAKLVVLSCCHSARGEITAEGVVGIARAFLGAGARSVLVSIWALDDVATLQFMKCFYRVLVKGVSASESLNQAMNYTRESNKLNEVKHWAPFQLIGDDVTLDFGMYVVIKYSRPYVDP